MVIEDKEQGGVHIHCEPGVTEIANAIAEKSTRSDAYGTTLFVMRLAQLIFKGDCGIDELISALKQARGEQSSLIIPDLSL
jgi:hypothetical protein